MTLLAGATISGQHRDWTLGPELGRGAFGRTHRVTAATGCEPEPFPCVAKVMSVSEADSWKSLALFEREVAVLRSLSHPGIPRFVEHIVLDDGLTTVLVMERVTGATLHARAEPFVPTEVLATWLANGLEILRYLHEHAPPVLHRDVTPKNLIVDGARLSLIDFGSVKAALRDSTLVTSVGTFGFMAPEQVLGRPCPASDLYGLGVSLLCAATGSAPHELPELPDGSIDVTRLALPEQLQPILHRLTRPGLDARYRSARAALRHLHEDDPGEAVPSMPSVSGEPDDAPARADFRWHPLIGVLLGVLLVGGGLTLLSGSLWGFGVASVLSLLGGAWAVTNSTEHGALPLPRTRARLGRRRERP